MVRRIVPSLSVPVFVEVLVEDRRFCVKTWKESPGASPSRADDPVMDPSVTRSLSFPRRSPPGEFPPPVSGIYFRYLPCARLKGHFVAGEDLDSSLAGRVFEARGYSLLDLEDPSIGAGERADGAVWTVGIDYDGYARPAYNALAAEASTGMHPLRSARQSGAPACLFVYQPFGDVPFTSCGMTLKYNQGLGFRSNVGGWAAEEGYDYLGDMKKALPSMSLLEGGGEIEPEGWRDVRVEVVADGRRIERDGMLKIESTGGYLPLREVPFRRGVAEFRVGAPGLRDGDAFVVRAGLGNLRNVLSISFQVKGKTPWL